MMQTLYTFLLTAAIACPLAAQTPIGQQGNASYYNDKYIGARTSNGEAYTGTEFTAAHLSFPFGSLVKITSPTTQKSVVVRINDRLSDKSILVINLSMAAAKVIGLDKKGREIVDIELVKNFPLGEWHDEPVAYSAATKRANAEPTETAPEDTRMVRPTLKVGKLAAKKLQPDPPIATIVTADTTVSVTNTAPPTFGLRKITHSEVTIEAKGYAVQIAAMSTYNAALTVVNKLQLENKIADVLIAQSKAAVATDNLFLVFVGPFSDEKKAMQYAKNCKANGSDAFVVNLAKLNPLLEPAHP
jgi:rare lipoprotein A (peptidoglycan hydrolase)